MQVFVKPVVRLDGRHVEIKMEVAPGMGHDAHFLMSQDAAYTLLEALQGALMRSDSLATGAEEVKHG